MLSVDTSWNNPLVLYFLGILTRQKACVYTDKIQVTRGIFCGM